jgi:hypothetical protein
MKRKLSMALLASLTLVTSQACKKDKKEAAKGDTAGDTSGAAKATDGKAGDKAAPSGDSAQAADGDFLSYMPVDTEAVVGISLANLTQSKLWAQYQPMFQAAMDKEFAEFKEACGFDPITTIKGVYVGINSAKEEEPVVVVDGVKRDVLGKCIQAMAKKEGDEVTVKDEGKLTIVTSSKEDENVTIGWINDSKMVMTPKKNDAAWVTERIEGKNSITGNKSFMAVADAAKQSQPFWFAAKFADGSPAAKGLSEIAAGVAPMGIYGSFGFTTGLDIDLGVRFKTGEEATKLAEMAKTQIGAVKPMLGAAASIVDKLDLKAVGNDLQVKLSITEADIKTLEQVAGPMLGGMGGL